MGNKLKFRGKILTTALLTFVLFTSCEKEQNTNHYISPPEDHLLIHYAFDKNIQDQSTFSNHGSNFGTLNFTESLFENAVSFYNTGNSYLQCSKYIRLDTSDFTISFWLRAQYANSKGTIIQCGIRKAGSTTFYGYSFSILGDGKLYFECGNGNQAYSLKYLSNSLINNAWHHVCFVHKKFPSTNKAQFQIFIDNTPYVLKETVLYPILNEQITFHKTSIGKCKSYMYDGDPYLGELDQFRIYNRALTETEINYLYLER